MEREAPGTAMWLQLAMDSVFQPRGAARRLLALDVPRRSLVDAAVAVTCIGLVLGYVGLRLSGGAVDPVSAALLGAPFVGAVVQFAVMAGAAFLTWRVGRSFGGQGEFWGALRVVVWLNAVTLGIQVVQLVALAVAPFVAGPIAIATLFWLLWAFASFVTELHAFTSPMMVLGVTVLTVVMIVIGLTILAAVLGLSSQGA